MVHHSKYHWNISALEGQQLDGSQIRHRAVETDTQQPENQSLVSHKEHTRVGDHHVSFFIGVDTVRSPTIHSTEQMLQVDKLLNHHLNLIRLLPAGD